MVDYFLWGLVLACRGCCGGLFFVGGWFWLVGLGFLSVHVFCVDQVLRGSNLVGLFGLRNSCLRRTQGCCVSFSAGFSSYLYVVCVRAVCEFVMRFTERREVVRVMAWCG